MSEINVELVRYDTKKTKKRKRANLIVSAKTEEAVIEKLEKIHKGDQVETIYEIVWGEARENPKSKKGEPGKVITGIVKFYNLEKGFGFITPDTDEEDLFFHSTALNGEKLYENDLVEFEVSVGQKGPIAIHIKLINDYVPLLSEEDFEGTLVLENLAEIGKVDEFFDAVDSDNFKQVQLLMEAAKIDSESIKMVLEKMNDSED